MAWDSLLKRTETATTPKIHGWNLRIRPWKKGKKHLPNQTIIFRSSLLIFKGVLWILVSLTYHILSLLLCRIYWLSLQYLTAVTLSALRQHDVQWLLHLMIHGSEISKFKHSNITGSNILAELEWTHYSFNQFSELKDIWWPGYRCVSSLFYL